MLRNFQGELKKILGGRGLSFFQEGLRIFHKGLGFFGKGLIFSSLVFEIVSVMVMLFLGRGSFSGRLRFFREWFKFFGGVEVLSEVFEIFFGRGWDYFRGIESVQGI